MIHHQDSYRWPQEQNVRLLVGPEGPVEATSTYAVNIWQEIISKFPYFPRLHRILSTRPNITPPVIITGTGPRGRSIIYNHPPNIPPPPSAPIDTNTNTDVPPLPQPWPGFAAPYTQLPNNDNDIDANIDPELRSTSTPHHSSPPPSPSFATITPPSDTPSPSLPPIHRGHKPKSSSYSFSTSTSLLDAAVAKAKDKVQRIPAKRGLEDVLTDHLEQHIRDARHREERNHKLEHHRLYIEEHKAVMKEAELCQYTPRKISRKLTALRRRYSISDNDDY
ncbi:hypothetical protein ONZ45_g18315 [Pleurotus djamor]|nr:hypothetical protein ONZ45_g18315 [Pleurotus djamor]